MKISGIYCITNTVTGRRYIGQSTDIKVRWACHRGNLSANRHPNPHLQNSWNKHGSSVFDFSLLEEVEASALNTKEQEWIAVLRSNEQEFGYNMDNGGLVGRTYSPEARAKMSAAQRGRKHSAETKKKMSRSAKGRVFSKETRAKMTASRGDFKHKARTKEMISKAMKGRKFSEETIKRMSEARRRYWESRKASKGGAQ